MCSIEICFPDNMHVMPVYLDQCGHFLALSTIATRRLLPPKNLDRSKRNKMCSKDNDLAFDKHEASFNLVPKMFFALAANQFAHHHTTRPKKSWRTVCTYGSKVYTYGRVSHRFRPTQSYLFTLTAEKRA